MKPFKASAPSVLTASRFKNFSRSFLSKRYGRRATIVGYTRAMNEEHPTDAEMIEFSKYEMRTPESAILQRHLRFCKQCNRQYKVLTLDDANARKAPDLLAETVVNRANNTTEKG